ncbi:hypothetical protein ACFLWW_03575 [Chloroflexota bacterium]
MINVTDDARKELKRILSDRVDMPQARLRLLRREHGQLGLGIDIEMPDDELVKHDGSTVLVVEHGLSTSLKGLTLDVDDASAAEAELVMYCE